MCGGGGGCVGGIFGGLCIVLLRKILKQYPINFLISGLRVHNNIVIMSNKTTIFKALSFSIHPFCVKAKG